MTKITTAKKSIQTHEQEMLQLYGVVHVQKIQHKCRKCKFVLQQAREPEEFQQSSAITGSPSSTGRQAGDTGELTKTTGAK